MRTLLGSIFERRNRLFLRRRGGHSIKKEMASAGDASADRSRGQKSSHQQFCMEVPARPG